MSNKRERVEFKRGRKGLMKDPSNNGAWVTTHTGRGMNLRVPDPTRITRRDIARGLSRIVHFGGALDRDITVAEHTLLGYRWAAVPGRVAVHFLLHDAAEAYMGDVRGPLKRMLPDFQRIEALVQEAIYRRFGLDPKMYSEYVRTIDARLLRAEAWYLQTRGRDWDPPVVISEAQAFFGRDPDRYRPLSMHEAGDELLYVLRRELV